MNPLKYNRGDKVIYTGKADNFGHYIVGNVYTVDLYAFTIPQTFYTREQVWSIRETDCIPYHPALVNRSDKIYSITNI